jgi:hypothetical protein
MGADSLDRSVPQSSRKFKEAPIVILTLLLMPVLFINTGNYHDWGDDFGQYMLQGYHLLGMKSDVNVACTGDYGPALKGPLFSLILTPALLTGGPVYLYCKALVGIALIITGLLLYRISAELMKSSTAGMLSSLFLVYNAVIIVHKDQILPDTIFMTFLLSGILFFRRSSLPGVVICSAVLFLIKPVGALFPISVIILWMADSNLKGSEKLTSAAVLFIGLAAILPVSVFWPNQPEGDTSLIWYLSTISRPDVIQGFPARAYQYLKALELFVDNDVPWFVNRTGKVLTLIFLLTGMTCILRSSFRIVAVFIILYILTILIYPYHEDPLRLLVLIFPLIIITALHGSWAISNFLSIKAGVITVPFLVVMFLSNIPNALVSASGQRNSDGPFTAEFNELNEYIRTEVPPEELLMTEKPWAVALMTGRTTVPLKDPATLSTSCYSGWMLHILNMKTLYKIPVNANEQVFRNNEFRLFRISEKN